MADAIDLKSVDFSDPCACAAALRQVLNKRLINGGDAIEIRAGDEWTKYAPLSIEQLNAEITRLDVECAAKIPGARSPRAALQLGAGRRFPPWSF